MEHHSLIHNSQRLVQIINMHRYAIHMQTCLLSKSHIIIIGIPLTTLVMLT